MNPPSPRRRPNTGAATGGASSLIPTATPFRAANRPTPSPTPSGPAAPVPPASFHIPSLDGIRAVSILFVFIAHIGYEDIVPGGFGVTIFFFLSGYLITTLLRRELRKHDHIDIPAFYKRRAWRILPPMYLCLAFAVLMWAVGFTANDVTPGALFLQVFHLTNFLFVFDPDASVAAGTFAYWSLAIEEHFYLVYPFVAGFLLRMRSSRDAAMILLGVCAVVLAWRYVLVVGFDVGQYRTYLGTDTRIDAIAFGCVLGLWHNPALDPVHEFRPVARHAITAACLVVLAASLLVRDDVFRETLRYSVQSAALAPLFYLAIVHHKAWPFAWLNIGWVKFLGVLSYVFYLTHQVFIFGLQNHTDLGRIPIGAISFVLSVAFAWGMHVVVEKPVAKIRHRLSRA